MMDLKVGDKVRVLYSSEGFHKNQVVEVYRLSTFSDTHLFKGENSRFANCNGEEGAWLQPRSYEVVPEPTQHPHADLMLKYAVIAQYDAKPWESFEFLNKYDEWVSCTSDRPFNLGRQLRLKPQPLEVQIGQTWTSINNGQEVQVFRKPYPSEGGCCVVKKWVVGVVLDESINLVTSVVVSEMDLINHFKRKG